VAAVLLCGVLGLADRYHGWLYVVELHRDRGDIVIGVSIVRITQTVRSHTQQEHEAQSCPAKILSHKADRL
jgi:hypothetical protein